MEYGDERELMEKSISSKVYSTQMLVDLLGLEGCMGSHVRIGADVVVVVGRHSFLLAYLIYRLQYMCKVTLNLISKTEESNI